MLAAVVHGYLGGNEVTPAFALTLFIVVVLAAFWILATLILYSVAKHNGYFVAFIDLCFFGALIAGVVEANSIATQSCSNYNITSNAYKESGVWVYNFGELCNLVKASYAFAIIELILFFFTIVSYHTSADFLTIISHVIDYFHSFLRCGSIIPIKTTIATTNLRTDGTQKSTLQDIEIDGIGHAEAVGIVAVITTADTTMTGQEEEERPHGQDAARLNRMYDYVAEGAGL